MLQEAVLQKSIYISEANHSEPNCMGDLIHQATMKVVKVLAGAVGIIVLTSFLIISLI